MRTQCRILRKSKLAKRLKNGYWNDSAYIWRPTSARPLLKVRFSWSTLWPVGAPHRPRVHQGPPGFTLGGPQVPGNAESDSFLYDSSLQTATWHCRPVRSLRHTLSQRSICIYKKMYSKVPSSALLKLCINKNKKIKCETMDDGGIIKGEDGKYYSMYSPFSSASRIFSVGTLLS